MKKRFACLLMVFGLTFALAPSAAAYSDVPDDCWSYGDISAATEAGVFQGVSTDAFDRYGEITRAQFAAAMARLFRWEIVTPEMPSFSDCESFRWYYSYVETVRANGALPAYSSSFRPTDAITREEMAAMLVRALGYSTLAGQLSNAQLPFSDITSNPGYIAVAYDLGIITGYEDGTFRPKAAASREQAAVMLMRVYNKLYGSSTDVSANAADYIPIRVSTPAASAETVIPTTPLEPLASLYNVLHHYRAAGTDTSKLAVVFTAGGVSTTTRGSRIVSTETVSAAAVQELLAKRGTNVYYSDQHQSAYLTANISGDALTVWYQNEQSLAAKLQLCRLFGINHYILQDIES